MSTAYITHWTTVERLLVCALVAAIRNYNRMILSLKTQFPIVVLHSCSTGRFKDTCTILFQTFFLRQIVAFSHAIYFVKVHFKHVILIS